MTARALRLALPKGSLQEATLDLFRKAGFRIHVGERSYFPVCDDEELVIMLVRSQEIPTYVADGAFDAGLTGYDWVRETGAKVHEVCELLYAKAGYRPVRWVLAVPKDARVKTTRDLQGKRIATELVNVTKAWFRSKGVTAKVEFSWGATEAKPPLLADAIVELTESGASLRANNLRIVDEVLQSTTRLIANPLAYQDRWKREKLESLSMLLKGALAAEGLVGLKMNVRRRDLARVEKLLPALKKPTIASLSDPAWVAVEVVLEEAAVKRLIPGLKRAGAQGLIEYPLNKVIP